MTDRERFDRWQTAAVHAWDQSGRIGIVEAVTGSGKTHVAHKVISRLREEASGKPDGTYRLIVVPTIPLLEQWKRGLERAFPGEKIGLLGGGNRCHFGQLPFVIVSTIHSAVNHLKNGAMMLKFDGPYRSLLIVDECHHVLSPTAKLYGQLVGFPFDHRLGLSATMDQWSIDGLGEIIYEYNLRKALDDGIIPPFDIVNVSVELSPSEKDEYLHLEEKIGKTLQKIKKVYDLFGCPESAIWIELRRLASEENCPLVQSLFGYVFKKAALVYTASERISLAPQIIRLLVNGGGRKLLAFFERIQSMAQVQAEAADPLGLAERTADALSSGDAPVHCTVFHSGLGKDQRSHALGSFRQNGPGALLACRALNEGLDVPSVDGAVIVASTQNRRSLIQRIGRTLRVGKGKKRPLVVIFYAKGCPEAYTVRVAQDDEYFQHRHVRIFDVSAEKSFELIGGIMRDTENDSRAPS